MTSDVFGQALSGLLRSKPADVTSKIVTAADVMAKIRSVLTDLYTPEHITNAEIDDIMSRVTVDMSAGIVEINVKPEPVTCLMHTTP